MWGCEYSFGGVVSPSTGLFGSTLASVTGMWWHCDAELLSPASARSFSLLRCEWQSPPDGGVRLLCQPFVVQMAEPPQSAALDDLGSFSDIASRSLASDATHLPQSVSHAAGVDPSWEPNGVTHHVRFYKGGGAYPARGSPPLLTKSACCV
jgi:hypothetical protein